MASQAKATDIAGGLAILDAAAYPHILEVIIDACLADSDATKALRAVSRATRDAIEAKLARHIVVRSRGANKRWFLTIRSHSGHAIPGVRARDYAGLVNGDEGTTLAEANASKLARVRAHPTRRPSTQEDPSKTITPEAVKQGDVTPSQAIATISRVLAHTRIIDVGDTVLGGELAPLAQWVNLDTVRLPSYHLAGRADDNSTLPAHIVVLAPDTNSAYRIGYLLHVPPGTQRLISHEFYEVGMQTNARVSCTCGCPVLDDAASALYDGTCACRTVREVVLAFVQRIPSGMHDRQGCTPGFLPMRVNAIARAFPNAKVTLVGAEAARLGRDPPVARPFNLSNDEIKRKIVDESELVDSLREVADRVTCVKLSEWREAVGEERWAVEMGLGDVQVLARSKPMTQEVIW